MRFAVSKIAQETAVNPFGLFPCFSHSTALVKRTASNSSLVRASSMQVSITLVAVAEFLAKLMAICSKCCRVIL